MSTETTKAELPSTPDHIIPVDALAFYGDCWAEALGKAAFYLNSHPEKNRHHTEPMIRLVHYATYAKPFTCTLVLPK